MAIMSYFFKGVGHGEELGVEGERLDGALQGEPALLLLTEGGVDAAEDALLRLVLDVVKLSHGDGHEVGGHDGARPELDHLEAGVIIVILTVNLRHVGQHYSILTNIIMLKQPLNISE